MLALRGSLAYSLIWSEKVVRQVDTSKELTNAVKRQEANCNRNRLSWGLEGLLLIDAVQLEK